MSAPTPNSIARCSGRVAAGQVKTLPAALTFRGKIVQIAKFNAGPRAGRFLKVAFNDGGQPFEVFGSTAQGCSTEFYGLARARQVITELRRRGKIGEDEKVEFFHYIAVRRSDMFDAAVPDIRLELSA